MTPGDVWVVAGAPGSGKSTVAAALLRRLSPVPAVLDKDVLFSGFVDAILSTAGRSPGEREGEWYDRHIKTHEYAGMTAAAAAIRAGGCPVLLDGPFTGQIRSVAGWRSWTAELGGDPVRLVWVRCDPPTLLARLTARGRPRDAGKIAAFGDFVARMRPEEPPPVPHLLIENGAGAPSPDDQLAAALARPPARADRD